MTMEQKQGQRLSISLTYYFKEDQVCDPDEKGFNKSKYLKKETPAKSAMAEKGMK